jgi:hypothetical protein
MTALPARRRPAAALAPIGSAGHRPAPWPRVPPALRPRTRQHRQTHPGRQETSSQAARRFPCSNLDAIDNGARVGWSPFRRPHTNQLEVAVDAASKWRVPYTNRFSTNSGQGVMSQMFASWIEGYSIVALLLSLTAMVVIPARNRRTMREMERRSLLMVRRSLAFNAMLKIVAPACEPVPAPDGRRRPACFGTHSDL